MKSSIIVIVSMALGITGCSQENPIPKEDPSPLVARFDIDFPGATPEMVDEMTAAFWPKVLAIPGIRSVTCISRKDTCEGYVVTDSTEDLIELQDRLYSAISNDDLPVDTGRVAVRFIKGGVPIVTPRNVPTLEVELNRQMLARLGLSSADVTAQLQRKLPDVSKDDKTIEAVEMLTITDRNGNPVPIRDVATVTIEMKPDCIVRTY